MSDKTAIEWTDTTWNPVRGCTKVSPGCANCYAETFAERWRGVPGHAYEQGFDLRLVPDKLDEPLRWKKPRRVFVNSMSDLFQEGVPDEYIDRVFAVMGLAHQHTFQVLTKRADRMLAYCKTLGRHHETDRVSLAAKAIQPDGPGFWWNLTAGGWCLPNVWLGVSVENQHFADERIPLLLQTPAAIRFVSAEPLLQEVNLRLWLCHREERTAGDAALDWVIVGGESGPGARPCDASELIAIVAQCRHRGVPVFVKQFGARPWINNNDPKHRPLSTDRREAVAELGDYMQRVFSLEFKDKKGGDMAEWPEELRVREFPEARQ